MNCCRFVLSPFWASKINFDLCPEASKASLFVNVEKKADCSAAQCEQQDRI